MDGFGVICGGCTKVDRVPCDTQMRTRLDRVPARALRPVFRRLFRELQRGKVLKPYAVYGHHYLLSLDGTDFFSSGAVRCKYCCERRHRNGTVTYHHQMLAGAIVHPDCRAVIPLAPEPICPAGRSGEERLRAQWPRSGFWKRCVGSIRMCK